MTNALENIFKSRTVGYVRKSPHVASKPQLVSQHLDTVYRDTAAATSVDRPNWRKCVDELEKGDTLFVESMSIIARNTRELADAVESVLQKGATLRFVQEGWIGNQSTLTFLRMVAKFEQECVSERHLEGIEEGRLKGHYRGSKPSLTPEQAAELVTMAEQGIPKTEIAKHFGIRRETVYSYLKRME